jgi:polysaccharide biosynthesis protein PelF
MPGRRQHAIEIPSMVDLSEFDQGHRAVVRAEWGVDDGTPIVGWVGRLDRKKRAEDFLRAAALVRERYRNARFLIIGGPDAFMPEYARELRLLAAQLGLNGEALRFLGDRPDVPRLLTGLDAFVWLARDEGMPHVIAEAGAARLPVVATRDNGTAEQITHGETGLFVPHEAPHAVARALQTLLADPDLRYRLGSGLRCKVKREYSVAAVIPQWESLFDDVISERMAEHMCPLADGIHPVPRRQAQELLAEFGGRQPDHHARNCT